MKMTLPSRTMAAFVVGFGLLAAGCSNNESSTGSNENNGVILKSNQVAIYYQRQDHNYDGWGLHVWDDSGCDLANAGNNCQLTDWSNPLKPDAIDGKYGAYFIVNLNANRNDSQDFKFIVHSGDEKDIDGSDLVYTVKSFGKDAYTVSGYNKVSGEPITVPLLSEVSAHLVTAGSLVWDAPSGTEKVELVSARNGGLTNNSDSSDLDAVDRRIMLESDGTLPIEEAGEYPYLSGKQRWTLPEGTDLKSMLKGQLAILAKDKDGKALKATEVQAGFGLDALYFDNTKLGSMQLGAVYNGDRVDLRVWAPTAKSVKLLLAGDAEASVDSLTAGEMIFDKKTGVWSYSGSKAELDRKFYRYQVEVYRRDTGKVETTTVTDPYSLAVTENGRFTQIVNLDDDDLKPAGWDNISKNKPNDISVYETHIRDISTFDCGLSYKANDGQCPANVDGQNNGKYNAFTEFDRPSMKHLQKLQQAGLTYVQVLPAFDIATVNENPEKVADLTDSFDKLCELNPEIQNDNLFAGYCASSQTVGEVFEATRGDEEAAQALSAYLRPFDSFNWGYDPYHYGAPENSYASKTDGITAVKEFRGMVKGLNDMGLHIVMDVVYNHTNAAGLSDKSVLDKIVPDYYQRLNIESGTVETSTCCSNTASEVSMMEKLMVDTLKVWVRDYKVDAFRFDLMGHHLKANMEKIQKELKAINPDIYLYGEGWEFGEIANGRIGESAVQKNMDGTGIGTFTDRLRDAVRGGGPFDGGEGIRRTQGFGSGFWEVRNELNQDVDDKRIENELNNIDIIRLGMAGNLRDYPLKNYKGETVFGKDIDYNGQPAGYTASPVESVNYVSKHDNQTLWDNHQYKLAENLTTDDRVRMHVLSLALPVLSQGVPFIHMGSDILRSKSMERDSYDSGDWYNKVMFNLDDQDWNNTWNHGLPRGDKDAGNWDLIRKIVANDEAQVNRQHARFAAEMFREYLNIRKSSPLFHLKTAEQVSQVVKFHNVGPQQVKGLIAMELDDSQTNLDNQYKKIMVMVNATAASQSLTVKGAVGYQLHPVQQQSTDSVVKQSAFKNGSFSIPARSVVIFVKS
ncbi:pullulanase-type alpha-1,6-glucosidase [Endozoicomonas sp. Mp262]|uniref:pullulanase-type alpha-1,6-glucosidase n=1 Tax=Endozoicomonas sp. Mp262 TaxID=2919499 RepID=UPI0021D7D250